MSSVEKFIGESQLKSTPTKKFTFIIDDEKVTTAKIADNAITEEKISGEDTPKGAAVTTSKIKDGAVTNPKIANGAVTTIKIQDFDAESSFPTGVTNEKLADASVTESKLASGAVTDGKIAPNAITAGKIANDAVIAGNIANGAITHDNLTDDCVQQGNIANGAVEHENLAPNAVQEGNIAPGAIHTEDIHDGAVTTAKIEDYNPNSATPTGVTTAKIADYNVTEAKLADGAVTMAKLADDTISKMETITDATPTEGSVKPIQSGGVQEALLDRAIVGDIVGDPTEEWVPGTAEAYIDQRINEQNNLVNTRMNRQDTIINATNGTVQSIQQAVELLNGSEVIVVADHTQVATPDSQKIYREQGTTTYTDWMYQGGAWKEIATYSFPGIDDEPTAGSKNLVESGGVEKYLAKKIVLSPSEVGIEVGGMVINGSTVMFDSTKTAYRTYGRANDKRIHLLKGDTIYLSNLGTPTIATGYSAFTKVVTNNGVDSYECLVQGKGTPAQYVYKAKEEMDIIVCSQGATMTVSRLMQVATEQSLEDLTEDVHNNSLRVDSAQDFTEAQKSQALSNLGIAGIGGGINKDSNNLTISKEVFDGFKDENTEISKIREFLGNQETVEYGKYDFAGIYFNGTDAFVAATSRFDGLIIKVFKDVTYNIGSIENTRFLTTVPVLGSNTGIYVSFPYTPNVDGYLLVTVEKVNAPFTLTKGIDGLYKDYLSLRENVNEINSIVSYLINADITIHNRISQAFYLKNANKEMLFTCKVISGTDTGRYRLYNTNGTSIGTALTDQINLGDSIKINIPSNGYVWLFTETVLTSSVTYNVYAELTDAINNKIENLSEVVNSVDFEVNGTVANVNITKSAYRVNKALYIGHSGEKVKMYFNVVSGVDTGGWAVYGTNEAGTAMDASVVLVDYHNTAYGVPEEFVVPSNGYVWLFTEFNPSSSNARTYNVVVALMTSIVERVGDIESEVTPFAGKTIVCFGDSITEFKGTDQKRYSDWLEEMLGATVINVGIGGTQIRQRTTPSATPSGSNQCYAGLDMVNLVKAAMEQDFTIARASAQELARISADDNTAIVERLAAIDWSKVDIVTSLAGTNDWTGNVGNTGNIDSTDINETCGAMNNIISKICSTHKNIKVYWFTPIIRYVDPADFSTSTSYSIGDLCAYSGAYYRFVTAHQGAWNAEDVEQITRADCRIPELFSDNKVLYGKNLREFCSLLESVAVKNHIPVLNTYNTLGWNQYNFSNFFPNYDNTHPYIGFKSLAEKLSKFLIAN